ncbi:MAG: hypothetical protein GWP15_00525 [Nitrospirae bacterium]|nr:hypothetical protein [Nitrospirota bacterium]
MASDLQINKVSGKPSLEAKKESTFGKIKESKEVRKAAIGKEAIAEAVGHGEAVAEMGEVGEVAKERAEQKGGAVRAGAARVAIDPETIRANLLKNLPNEKVMRKQIEGEIRKEIKYLHNKAVKLMAVPSGMSFFEIANLMKKIRELKGILVELLKSSMENLKTLWLRFVHGVM